MKFVYCDFPNHILGEALEEDDFDEEEEEEGSDGEEGKYRNIFIFYSLKV